MARYSYVPKIGTRPHKERAGNLCANLGCGPVRAYEPKADPGPVRLGSQISGVANPDLQR